VSAQTLTTPGTPADDIKFAVGQLRKSRLAFISAITNLSDAQWNFKPAPGRWSIAECAEHLAVAEQELLRVVRSASFEPLAADMRLPGKTFDREVLKMVADRTNKAEATDAMKPSGRFKDQTAVRQEFWELRNESIRFVETSSANLRNHAMMNEGMKRPLDCLQWMLLISAHTERHTAQIEEVKGAAGYPK
jgi:uncharacterized damage-inducible protein DinB